MSVTLFHYDTFDCMQLNIDKLIEGENLLKCNLSVNNNKLMFFIDQLPLIKFNEDESYILLDIKNNPEYKKLFQKLDTAMILHIQESEIAKTYKLKNYDYISFINSYTNIEGMTTDVIKCKVNLSDSENRTNIFYKYGYPIENLDVIKNKNNTILVKTVLECINLTIDLTNKNIYIDNCARQLKVKLITYNNLNENNTVNNIFNKEINLILNEIDNCLELNEKEMTNNLNNTVKINSNSSEDIITSDDINGSEDNDASEDIEELDGSEDIEELDGSEDINLIKENDNISIKISTKPLIDYTKIFKDNKPCIRELSSSSDIT